MTHRVRSYGLLVASAAALLVSRSARAEFPQILLNTDATTQLQNEQQVTINPLDPDNAVACWRDFRLGYRQVGVGYTFDGGQTWTDFLIGGELPWDSDPVITVDDDGTFYMVVINYQDGGANQLSVHRSNTGGVSWDGPFTAVFSPGTTFEDKEWIAVDRTGGPRNGNVYIAWARFYDVQIHCVTSTDRGATWSPPTPVSSASSSGQWPVPVVLQNGNLLVAWDRYDDDVIAYDVSTNGGATWGTDRILSSCTTGVQSTINGGIGVFPFPALCVDESDGFRAGWVYCLYADEPVASNGMDIWIRHSSDNGNTWSERVRVNDDPLGQNRDQFHPWISCDEQGVLYAMWYDRRDDASNLDWHIYASRSQDGGLTWETNERITDVPSSPSDAAARDVAGGARTRRPCSQRPCAPV
ncbi:MAG: sialidase family protein [Candidatus Eisenbacteria bacterium]